VGRRGIVVAAVVVVLLAGAGGATGGRQAAQRLTASDEQGAGAFGYSVAFSGDAQTLLVGGYKDGLGLGAAWIFKPSASSWSQQGSKLIAPDEHGTGWFGQGVALSDDGQTVLVGIPQENANTGTARIFVRTPSGYVQQAELNSGGDQDALGLSVALSGEGNVALVGAPKHNLLVGGAYVFTRTGSTWHREPTVLAGRGELRNGEFGLAVAMSDDGTTAAVGGPSDDSGSGAVWTFNRSGARWVPGPKLVPHDEDGKAEFGYSVALSADGRTMLVGGFRDRAVRGAAWVYTRTGAGWQEQAKLTSPTTAPEASFGFSVALSHDGSAALLGGPGGKGGSGAAWLFRRTGAAWKQRAAWSGTPGAGLGYGVALSPDGTLAAIGAPNDAAGAGAVLLER
jgi:hypothetical protein